MGNIRLGRSIVQSSPRQIYLRCGGKRSRRVTNTKHIKVPANYIRGTPKVQLQGVGKVRSFDFD